jgi:hypothetical protein
VPTWVWVGFRRTIHVHVVHPRPARRDEVSERVCFTWAKPNNSNNPPPYIKITSSILPQSLLFNIRVQSLLDHRFMLDSYMFSCLCSTDVFENLSTWFAIYSDMDQNPKYISLTCLKQKLFQIWTSLVKSFGRKFSLQFTNLSVKCQTYLQKSGLTIKWPMLYPFIQNPSKPYPKLLPMTKGDSRVLPLSNRRGCKILRGFSSPNHGLIGS